MALQAKYKEYLARPSESHLAGNASLNYVPTTTSLNQPAAILKHLNVQNQAVEKKSEKFLNVIEGLNSLCVETETTLHFQMGGGVYLPSIDDNFLADKTVTLPITHIVIFNEENMIQQIRLLWDQGCLLKSVDTIGARGRGWPIRDGKEQVKLIIGSSVAAPSTTISADEQRLGRHQSHGVDPHSSLSLFEQRPPTAREPSPQKHNVAPRASAKPAPREYTDLFAAGSTDPAMTSSERSVSPSKRDYGDSNPLKSGAGKNYHASRIFGGDDPTAVDSRERGIKTHAKKYSHFEFGDSDEPIAGTGRTMEPPTGKGNPKHLSQWKFEDFMTPEKPKPRHHPNQSSNLAYDSSADDGAKTPVYQQHIPKARHDAASHFSFEHNTPVAERTTGRQDSHNLSTRSGTHGDHVSSEPPNEHNPDARNSNNSNHNSHDRPTTSGSSISTRSGLYEDHISNWEEEGKAQGPTNSASDGRRSQQETTQMPLKNITNANQQQYNKTFGAHWELNEESPERKDTIAAKENRNEQSKIESKPEVKARANKQFESSWSLYDDSPMSEKEQRGIKIQGDGMGKPKTQTERSWWEYEDE